MNHNESVPQANLVKFPRKVKLCAGLVWLALINRFVGKFSRSCLFITKFHLCELHKLINPSPIFYTPWMWNLSKCRPCAGVFWRVKKQHDTKHLTINNECFEIIMFSTKKQDIVFHTHRVKEKGRKLSLITYRSWTLNSNRHKKHINQTRVERFRARRRWWLGRRKEREKRENKHVNKAQSYGTAQVQHWMIFDIKNVTSSNINSQ